MVIFGVMAIVLVALSGSVVDYVGVQQARTRAQVALDAATLSLQPSIYDETEAEIRTKAQALLTQQINDTGISSDIYNVDIDTEAGSLLIEARLNVPLVFVSLIGIDHMEPVIASEATRKKLNLEVVMVLDNSGSMDSYSRMTKLKTASKNAVDILFEGKATKDNVAVAVVPFTTMVNAGSSYANASWVDKTGNSDIANDNFDTDDNDATTFNGPVDRLALFGALSNVSWRGCFEARPYPYSTNDTVPSNSTPNTKFVPAFAPDEPGNKGQDPTWGSLFYNSYLDDEAAACVATHNCKFVQVQLNCNSGWNNCNSTTTSNTTMATYPNGTTQTGSNVCNCNSDSVTSDTNWQNKQSGSSKYKERTRICGQVSTLSDREKQERLCKYTGTVSTSKDGPNAGCPTALILPLNHTVSTIKNSINAMTADGGTNIHQGAIWGFHVISPSEPFTEGTAYDSATSKVMILMTDGENTFYTAGNMNNAQFNQAYGLPYNQREGNMSSTNNSMATRMNTLLSETCTNIKAADITIYTIGLSSPNTTTTNLIKNCASDASKAFFPSAASELDSIFEGIANELADLRLAQ